MASNGGVFVKYTPFSDEHLRHPGRVVETQSLNCVVRQEVNYKHSLPRSCTEIKLATGFPLISGVQLDSVIQAGEAHLRIVSGTFRQGYVIGDGAGVGKGRAIAGIIADNYIKGRKKSVWVSTSPMLIKDARRDMGDLLMDSKCRIKVIETPQNYNDISDEKGCLFMTYSTLGKVRRGLASAVFMSRIDQMSAWLGHNFEGVIVFDESHKAKGYSEDEKDTSVTGDAVASLQARHRYARVLYVSATLATDPTELRYMERLGFWSADSCFTSSQQFVNTVLERGISGSELVALELKQRGIFLSRQLSYDGIEFTCEVCPADEKFIRLYNTCTDLWTKMLAVIPKKKRSLFWSEQQKFFRRLCIASKLPQLFRIIRKYLDSGKCILIGMQSTGEAAYQKFRKSELCDKSRPCSPSRISLESLLLEQLKIPAAMLYTLDKDDVEHCPNKKRKSEGSPGEFTTDDVDGSESESGSSTFSPSSGSSINLLTNYEYHEIVELFKSVKDDLPLNPIDEIIMEFGKDMVAEMSGRTAYQLLQRKEGVVFAVEGKRVVLKGEINQLEQQRFQNGTARIAIITEAASTGISLHSNVLFKNTAQRVHIILETSWSATQAVQQLGRSFRTNQASPPLYVLLMSEIPGEKRFISTLARRMGCLGALCKGDRRSTTNLWDSFDVSAAAGRIAIKELVNHLLAKPSVLNMFDPRLHSAMRLEYISLLKKLEIIKEGKKSNFSANTKLISIEKFLNRTLSLPVEKQKKIISWLATAIEKVKDRNLCDGDMDSAISDIGEIESGNLSALGRVMVTLPDGVTSEVQDFQVMNILTWDGVSGVKEVKFFTKGMPSGRTKVIGALRKYSATKVGNYTIKIYRPHSGAQKVVSKNHFISNRYAKADASVAKTIWQHNTKYFMRGNCMKRFKDGACLDKHCSHQQPWKVVGILSGGLISMWSHVKGHIPGQLRIAKYNDEQAKMIGCIYTISVSRKNKNCSQCSS